ncbi:MAG: hypothetical protein FJ245_09900 [Nitrospira sp.]|nr:hypothetical protein [Nitrospira sp.]
MQQANTASSPNLFHYWRIIQPFRRMIAGLFIASIVATWLFCKFSTPLYEAKATLLPAKEDSLSGGGFSFGGGSSSKDSKGGGSGGSAMVMDALGSRGPTITDTLNVILSSRSVAERVVDQLNLTAYYGVNDKIVASIILQGEIKVKTTLFKSLELTVMSKDPKVAADIANAYFMVLDRMYKEFAVASAKRNHQFIEARLEEKKHKLMEAENVLKEFQTENRILTPAGEQAEAAAGAAASLHGEIVGHQVELAALREYATPSHPHINQLEVQISELQRQLDFLEQNQVRGVGGKRMKRLPLSKQVFPRYEETPALMLEMLRLTRIVKIEEAVYGMLLGMLETAKIAETKDLPTIQVMDAAIPPLSKSRPKTLQNVQIAAALSLVLGILLALLLDHLERARAQEQDNMDLLAAGASDYPAEDAHGAGNGDANGSGVYPVPPKEARPLYR